MKSPHWIKFSPLLLASLMLLLSSGDRGQAQDLPCWSRYSPENARQLWRGRAPVGQIEIVNDSDQLVTVTLFHPDSDGRVFATWNIKPGVSTFLAMDSQRINIGADWGIRIASSCIMPVGNAGQYSKRRYQVRSSTLFN